MPPYATVCAGCRLPAPAVRARLLLDGAFGTDRAPNPAASPPSIREDFEKDPRPRACLSYRVSAPSEDIHNFCRHTATQRRTLIPAPRPPFWRIQRSHLVRDKVIPNPEEDLVASAHHRLPKALRPRHASEKMNPGPVADTEKVHPIRTPPPTPLYLPKKPPLLQTAIVPAASVVDFAIVLHNRAPRPPRTRVPRPLPLRGIMNGVEDGAMGE